MSYQNVSFRGLVLLDLFSTLTDNKCSFLQILIVFCFHATLWFNGGSLPPLNFSYQNTEFSNSIHHSLKSILTSATCNPGKGKAYFCSRPSGNVCLRRLKSFVVTKTWNDLKPPKTIYNHLKPPTTTSKNLTTTYNHLKNIYNHLQTI